MRSRGSSDELFASLFVLAPCFASLLVPLGVCIGVLGVTGCGGSYYDRYSTANPDWFSTFPDTGAGLAETLAGLYAPHEFRYRRSISKLSVVQLTDETASELSSEQLERVLDAAPGSASYGVVATVDCRSEFDMNMYVGQKVDWLLLEAGRLTAWDVHEFGSRCVVGDGFRPAAGKGEALEEQLLRFRDATFPRSMGHTAEYYVKGMKYLEQGRLKAAEAMLDRGDETFDVSSPQGTRFARPSESVDTTDAGDVARARADLVYGIRMLRVSQPSGM